MGSITVKIPDEQKENIQELVEEKNYPNMSEWIRETIRKRIQQEERNGLCPDELERLLKVREKERRGEDEWIPHEEAMKEAGLEDED